MDIKPRFDPTINLGHIITFGMFILGGIGAWYNLNEKVSTLSSNTDLKFHQVDSNVADIKESIKENNKDIKQSIKDLKDDLRNPPIVSRGK